MKKSIYILFLMSLPVPFLVTVETAHAQRPQVEQTKLSMQTEELNRLTRASGELKQETASLSNLGNWIQKRQTTLDSMRKSIESDQQSNEAWRTGIQQGLNLWRCPNGCTIDSCRCGASQTKMNSLSRRLSQLDEERLQLNRRVREYNVQLTRLSETVESYSSRKNASLELANRLKADAKNFEQRYTKPKPIFESMPKYTSPNKLTFDENAKR